MSEEAIERASLGRAAPPRGARRIPRWLRALLTAFAFAMFFSLACVLSGVAVVLTSAAPDAEARRRFTARLNRGFRPFLFFLRRAGLIAFEPTRLPEGYGERAFLMVANHPTLLDVLLVLAAHPELVSVVKASWYRSPLLGPLLRRSAHVPGPGHDGDRTEGDAPVVRRIEAALEAGAPVLVFPEGTRSSPTHLSRFRRGAIEAAVRARVPILPLFIDVDPPVLTKGWRPWDFPDRRPTYAFEWLDPIAPEALAAGSHTLTRQLSQSYQALFARTLAGRATRSPTP